MKFNDFALGLVVAAFGVAVILHVRTFPDMAGMQYGPAFFPSLIGGAFVAIGAVLALSHLLARRQGDRGPLLVLPEWIGNPIAVARAAGVLLAVAAFAILTPYAGFLLTTIVITAALLALMGADWRVTLPLSIVLPFVLSYVFSTTLRVPLPRGPLERLFF